MATGEPASVVATPVHPDEANIAGQASRHTPRINQKATYPRSLPGSTKTVTLCPFVPGTSFRAWIERPTRIGHTLQRCVDSTSSLQPEEGHLSLENRFSTDELQRTLEGPKASDVSSFQGRVITKQGIAIQAWWIKYQFLALPCSSPTLQRSPSEPMKRARMPPKSCFVGGMLNSKPFVVISR